MGEFSAGAMGSPLSRFENLCGCRGVATEATE